VWYEHRTLTSSSLRPTVSLGASAASIPLLAASNPHPPRPRALCSFPRFFLRSVQIYGQAVSQAGTPKPPRAQASAPRTPPQPGPSAPSASAARDSQERAQARKILFLYPLTAPTLFPKLQCCGRAFDYVLLMIMGEQVTPPPFIIGSSLGLIVWFILEQVTSSRQIDPMFLS
jgi:hypothetical protein